MALLLASNKAASVACRRLAPKAMPVPARLATRPAALKSSSSSSRSAEEAQDKASEMATEAIEFVKTKWEATEDKPAAVIVGVIGLFLISTVGGIVNTIDRIPVISNLVELVGIGATAFYTYRYATYGPDREELISKVKSFVTKVFGK